MTAPPFRETRLADVLTFSGPLYRIPHGRHKRFVPFRVTGAFIDPASTLGKGVNAEAWAVLDSADGWREVAVFESGASYNREYYARVCAERLNAA